MRRTFKDSFFWQQDKVSQAKQSEIIFMRVVCVRISQHCVFLRQQNKVRLEESGLLNIENLCKVIEVQSCLQTSPNSVLGVCNRYRLPYSPAYHSEQKFNDSKLVLWRKFLKLKQCSVWSGQHALLILIRSSVCDTHRRCVAANLRPHITIQDLEIPFHQESDNIPQSSIGYFIASVLNRTATAGSDVVQSGRPIFDDFFQHLWPYIGNNTANLVFQMVKRLWLIRIDQ
ncbi:hypothetical protein TNCV_553791 [Trichonephila clavipes]|nr:hypothetical protein TNCV_553791 [Trichonephila clavipes]